MIRLFFKFYWKILGWKLSGTFPHQYKKIVLAVAPHTHWIDVMTGFVARQAMDIEPAKFLAKKELFVWPLGWVLRKLGGTPIDRFAKQGLVDQVAELFNSNETFMLGISPEGTRQRVDKLRTGFYYIAKKAGVPVVPIGFDYANKLVVIGKAFFAGDDEEADLKKVIAFYASIQGRNPKLDMRHLKL